MLQECDEEVLSYLTDIKVIYADGEGLVSLLEWITTKIWPLNLFKDFSIEYHFAENEWFANKVLTMTYFVTCEVNEDDPWSFEGATIFACQG